MKTKDIDKWFKGLDSFEIALMFPTLYEEIMMSADPGRCTINHFLKEAKETWDEMSLEEKEGMYNEYK
jgi:hypothetical protein